MGGRKRGRSVVKEKREKTAHKGINMKSSQCEREGGGGGPPSRLKKTQKGNVAKRNREERKFLPFPSNSRIQDRRETSCPKRENTSSIERKKGMKTL